MRLAAPGKTFIEAPTTCNSATCKSCAHCLWMAMNGLLNLTDVLERRHNEIFVEPALGLLARVPIDRMLDFAARHKRRVQASCDLQRDTQLFSNVGVA